MRSTIINGHSRLRALAILNISLIANNAHEGGDDVLDSPAYRIAKDCSPKSPQHRYQPPPARHHYRSAKQSRN